MVDYRKNKYKIVLSVLKTIAVPVAVWLIMELITPDGNRRQRNQKQCGY